MSKAGQQLESVVYMSSVAAVWDFGKGTAEPDYVFSEADWNEFSERTAREVEAGGGKAPWFLAYPASKNAAEQLVWDFKDEKKVGYYFFSRIIVFLRTFSLELYRLLHTFSIPCRVSRTDCLRSDF